MVLLFPNHYRVGASNLGLQLVYALLNDHPRLVCERCFLPDPGRPLLSLESGRPLADFPLIFYSLSFEGDSLNLLRMLAAAGLPLLSTARKKGDPLVVGGGVATFMNPEPLAPYTDLFVLGEAEAALPPVLDFLVDEWPAGDRSAILRHLGSTLPGCYAPAFYQVRYQPDQTLAAMAPLSGLPARIARPSWHQPAMAGYSRLLSPDAEFSNLFLAELGRGCSRGCRFCAAGFVYRPPRLWSSEAVLAALAQRPPNVERVGLLGMEMAAPAVLGEIAAYLDRHACALSFSSLRADALTPELLALLGQSRIKTAVLAPDGASERLRRVINKGLAEDDLLTAAEGLAATGITTLKLYCMLGLPTEEDEDLAELIALVGKIKQVLLGVGRKRGRLANILLSVSCFVPKPWTPFQWHPMTPVAELRRRLGLLKSGLGREANVRITAEPPDHAFFQATLARGDRRLGEALSGLIAGHGNWRRQLLTAGVDPAWYAMRQRGEEELFPWEIVDHPVRREYLLAEYHRALRGAVTAPCQPEQCRRCGACG